MEPPPYHVLQASTSHQFQTVLPLPVYSFRLHHNPLSHFGSQLPHQSSGRYPVSRVGIQHLLQQDFGFRRQKGVFVGVEVKLGESVLLENVGEIPTSVREFLENEEVQNDAKRKHIHIRCDPVIILNQDLWGDVSRSPTVLVDIIPDSAFCRQPKVNDDWPVAARKYDVVGLYITVSDVFFGKVL